MKIALVSPTPVPPAFGGMDRLLEGLLAALRKRHPSDLVTIPYDERSAEGVLRGYHDFYHLDLDRYDLVITYKAPAYMVRHPRQVCFLSHRLRVFYDLYEPGGAEYAELRDLIHFMDNWALDKSRVPYLFTVGETVSRRLRQFGGIESTPIHHPTTLDHQSETRPGEYFLCVGRLHPWKRHDLAIHAFLRAEAACPLKIIGQGAEDEALRKLAGDDTRVEFLGKVSDEKLASLYAGALATIFPPIHEDMGLITFESFEAGKPVLTTRDAGEPALIVEEGKTGFITDPTPEALAEKIDWMWENRAAVDAMQTSCRDAVREVTWDRLVDRLLDAGEKLPRSDSRAFAITNGRRPEPRIELLVTDNQIIDPPVGGGRMRILELYRHLPDDFNTTYVGAFDYPGPGFRDQQFAPNFREILTPLTIPHFKAHGVFHRLTRGDATIDVTMPLLGGLTPRYRRLIEEHVSRADILICAHPWMIPFLPSSRSIPLIYDSQNCECAIKGDLLSKTITGRFLAERVKRTERRAVRDSAMTLACSGDDLEAFVSLYGADPRHIHLAPNGVDCEEIRPPSAPEKEAARSRLGFAPGLVVIFTGSNYAPNLQGAEFIVTRMAGEFPDVQFAIVGGSGPMFEQGNPSHLVPKNVRLAGFVERETLLDFYRAADVALNPMFQGSGTNIKMLDYMAAGLPILTTSKGARGIEGKPGEHWLEVPIDLMNTRLREMLASPEQVRSLGGEGRRLVEAKYDWKAISANLAEALRRLIRKKKASAAPA